MYILYQIGDVVLYDALLGYNGDPVEAALSYAWENPSTIYQQAGGRQYHAPALRSLPQEVEFELSGRLFQIPHINASRMKSRIRSFAGRRHTPVILISFEEGYDPNCEPQLLWLVGYGMITEDSKENAYYGTESGGSFSSIPFEVTIAFSEPLQQLSQWFWEYRALSERMLDPYSGESSQQGLNGFRHPMYFTEITPYHYFVRWQESDTAYNPDFWGLNYLYQMSTGGQSADFVDGPLELFVYSNEDLWAAAPQPLYAFTNLDPFGNISIETSLKYGLFNGETVESIATLDLDQLDTDLAAAGYGGLLVDDTIFTGAVTPRPSFLKRGDTILTAVRPKWEYDQLFPGEISNGATWITFRSYLSNMQVAYNIDFRTT